MKIKCIKYIFILCFFSLLRLLNSPIVLAGSEMYQRCQISTDCIIGEYVFDNSGNPITTQICTIDIRDPSGTLIVDDGVMTAGSDGWHSYTTNVTSPEGLYRSLMYCDNSGDTGYLDKTFIIGTTFEDVDENIWDYSSRTLSSFGSMTSDVWNTLTSGLSTTSSIGKLLVDNVNTTISSRSSHSVTDVWNKLTSDTNTSGSIGELLSAKIDSLDTLVSINNQLLDKMANTPEIKVWYEKGSIILKIEINNPSATLAQTVEFKQKLPREVKPEHIIEFDGLDIDYDSTEELYYLFGEFRLGVKDTITKSVKIKNVWQISDSEVNSLRDKTSQAVEFLKDSSYYAQGTVLANEINASLDLVQEKQNQAVTPEEYIVVYRENVLDLETSKKNFETLNSLMLTWEGEKKVAANIGGIQITSTWGIILAVIFGIISVGIVNLLVLKKGRSNLPIEARNVSDKPQFKENGVNKDN